ncbi:hypothetical protein [Streptomyces sp. A1136]|uniref:hypothetical protein n=1 Tax=Streptomyces sp. A1136 TaxID=2563102 RepID=UPI00109ECCD0|nr:hypothetical protein [Streptomyces sp. A1136]THA47279.1 hypothetical protein E6R62_31590 [Streptomyces sp. A1136]
MSAAGGRAAFRRHYGASPLHLLLVLASFALAVYAGLRLFEGDALGVALWFVGAALLHDLVLLPLYATADRAAQLLFRTGTADTRVRAKPSVNYVRVPAFVSGLLLLVWWPLILRRVGGFTAATGLSDDGFLARWLLITAVLFVASAAVLIIRTRHGTAPARKAARARARARGDTK